MIKKSMMSFVLGLFVITSVPAMAATLKIGVVNLQKAIQETSAGKKAKKELETEVSKRQGELEKREEELKKQVEDLEKKKAVLSEDVLRQQEGQFQQQRMQFQQALGQTQMDLQRKERELLQPVLEKMEKVITEIAKKGEYTVILERSQNNVLWANDSVDITDEVVKAFEKTK